MSWGVSEIVNMNVDILNRSPLSEADIDTTILEFKNV